MEEALIEVPTMRRFAGIDLISDRIPDEITILTFRHLLEKYGLGEQVLRSSRPSSTKNKEGKRDLEMRQARRGNQWYHR